MTRQQCQGHILVVPFDAIEHLTTTASLLVAPREHGARASRTHLLVSLRKQRSRSSCARRRT
jgi:hypothetical protein